MSESISQRIVFIIIREAPEEFLDEQLEVLTEFLKEPENSILKKIPRGNSIGKWKSL